MEFANLGVMSDTHDDVAAIQRALEICDSYGVDRIIHCGDVVSPETIACFRGRVVDFVLGNMDRANRAELAAAIEEIGCVCHGDAGSLEFDSGGVFFTHGHLSSLLEDAIYSGEWDLVCSGHTHVALVDTYAHEDRDTTILNPGALRTNGSFYIVDSSWEPHRFYV